MKKAVPKLGRLSSVELSPLLLPIRLSVARFTQQGGDEVDNFLVRKHEFQGTERPLQYSFHSNISIKLFGGEGTKPGRGGRECVRLARDGGGYVRLSVQQSTESLGAERSIFLDSIETRTLLNPLLRLNDAVFVQVGAEVAVSADCTFRVDNEQLTDEEAQ